MPDQRLNELAGNRRSVFSKLDLVAAPAQVVPQPREEIAADGDERRGEVEGEVVGCHPLERAVNRRVGRKVAIQIVAAGGFTEIIEARHHGKVPVHGADIVGIAAGLGAKLALADEPIAKIGKERQVVGAEEARKLQVARRRQMPDVVKDNLAGVSLVSLSWVDGVVQVGHADRH